MHILCDRVIFVICATNTEKARIYIKQFFANIVGLQINETYRNKQVVRLLRLVALSSKHSSVDNLPKCSIGLYIQAYIPLG